MKHFIKKFNNLIKKTIFKVENKTNNKLIISKFNKYLITFISLLFFYLFYLSIPVLYGKNWVQENIEKKLLKDFKIHFSVSSDISYRILPSPHYLIKDSKIFVENNMTASIAEIKTLRVFVSQKNFFDKKKLRLKYIKINNANFSLLKNNLKLFKNANNVKFSHKRIKINNSNILFKDNSGEIVSTVRISKAFLFFDSENLLNLLDLKGKVFNIPFSLDYMKKFDFSMSEEINIIFKMLRLNIFDTYTNDKNTNNKRKNTISLLNSTINTEYKIEDDLIKFSSNNSRIRNTTLDFNGELSVDPFDLNLNVILPNIKLFKLFKINSTLKELIQTQLFFNDNINVKASIIANSDSTKKIFQKAEINFNIFDGKINFNKTKLINEKIGSIELKNSNLFSENNQLTLNTEMIIDIDNDEELFSLLQTNKKFRKPINNILINLNYDLLTNQFKFNYIKIDSKEINPQLFRIIEKLNDNSINNLNKSKRILNNFFELYEG